MDPSSSFQDVLRCNLCDTSVPPLYCQLCDKTLCKACAGDHLLDDTKEHKVVPIKQKWSPRKPMCPKHTSKLCDLYCKHCDNHICALCISSGKHDHHKKVDIIDRGIEELKSALNMLKLSIYPKYEKAASDIKIKIDDVKKNSKKMKRIINENGQICHQEIDNVIKKFLSIIEERESEQLDNLREKESNLNLRINEISQNIMNLEKIVDSKDVCLASEYKTRLPEISQLPRQICFNVIFPIFNVNKIDKKQLYDLFGSMSHGFLETELFD